jgi:hypothetical protein
VQRFFSSAHPALGVSLWEANLTICNFKKHAALTYETFLQTRLLRKREGKGFCAINLTIAFAVMVKSFPTVNDVCQEMN